MTRALEESYTGDRAWEPRLGHSHGARLLESEPGRAQGEHSLGAKDTSQDSSFLSCLPVVTDAYGLDLLQLYPELMKEDPGRTGQGLYQHWKGKLSSENMLSGCIFRCQTHTPLYSYGRNGVDTTCSSRARVEAILGSGMTGFRKDVFIQRHAHGDC